MYNGICAVIGTMSSTSLPPKQRCYGTVLTLKFVYELYLQGGWYYHTSLEDSKATQMKSQRLTCF